MKVDDLIIKRQAGFLTLMVLMAVNPWKVSAQTIASFSPTSGPIGTSVTIIGSNFSITTSNNIVFFGATRATVISATTTELTVTVPAGATYKPISVQVNGLSAYSSAPFVVTYAGSGVIDASSLGPKIDFGSGSGPYGVAVTDLDGDGKSDLVVSNVNTSSISVFRNRSSGAIGNISFENRVDFAAGAQPGNIAIGDLDGDGKPDLAVANANASSISIFINKSIMGSINVGSFADQGFLATGAYAAYPSGVSVGDLDGDGRLDLVVTNAGFNTISIFKNTTTGGTMSFAAKFDVSTGGNPNGVLIVDLDGDDKPDIACANYLDNTFSVFRNISNTGLLSSGSFETRIDFSTGESPVNLASGDLDRDGKSDIVVVNQAVNEVSAFKNTSSNGAITQGSFAPKIDFATGAFPHGVEIADLDGDGKVDLAITSTSTTVSILKNTTIDGAITTGAFVAKVDFISSSHDRQRLAVADLDGDGRSDIAVANNAGGSVSVLRNAKPGEVAYVIPSQTIAFSLLAEKTIGDPPFDISATASSGLPVQFGLFSDPSDIDGGRTPKISISGTRVTLVNPGRASIAAFQDGNSNYEPAPAVVLSFCVNPSKRIISISELKQSSAVLTANGTNGDDNLNIYFGNHGAQYHWFVNGIAETITAASSNKFTATKQGLYTVIAIADGCKSVLSDAIPVVVTGDISNSQSEISIYPVPAQDQLFVKGAPLNDAWAIINILGKESQLPIQASQDGAMIDIRGLSSGIYFLRVNDGTKMIHIKFIKE